MGELHPDLERIRHGDDERVGCTDQGFVRSATVKSR